MSHRFILAFSVFIVSISAGAQPGGNTVFNSMDIPVSSRAAALGGHFIAMKDGDITLGAINPSLLDSSSTGKLALGFVDYFAGSHSGYASYAHPLNEKVTLGAGLQYLSYGTMNETDITGQTIGQFSAGDYQFTAGAGYRIDSVFSAGVNLKLMYSDIAGYSALAVATDYSATFVHPDKKFTAAAVLRNIGVSLDSYLGEKQKLPFDIQLGITKRLAHAPFRFVLTATNLQKWDLTYDDGSTQTIDPVTGAVVTNNQFGFGDKLMRHLTLGSEFIISPNIFLRIGYNYRVRQELKVSERPGTAGFTYGLECRVKRFQLGYARAIYHLAGPSNHFTLSTSLRNW